VDIALGILRKIKLGIAWTSQYRYTLFGDH
jgi:hypothetical protein